MVAGVTTMVSWAPSRSTTSASGCPGDWRMMADASANVATSVPPTDTITSPGSMPASAAGGSGSSGSHSADTDCGMHSESAATVVVAVCTPMPLKMMVNRTMASSRFMNGPPSMTTIRFQMGSP